MKLKTLTIWAALLLAGGSLGFAAPLDGKQVAADAKWVAHVDLDTVKTGALAKKALNWWLGNDLVKQRLAAVKLFTGVDLTKDLHGVTFYGSRLAQNTGVVIVHAQFDKSRLAEIVRHKPDYRTADYTHHTLHTWTEKKGTLDEHVVTGCIFDPELLIVGRDPTEVKAALDVLDGKAAALAGSDSPLADKVPEGAVVMACVTGLSEAAIPLKSPVVKQTELFWAALGEQGEEVFVRMKLVATSDEAAGQIEDIVRGFRATALLQHGSNENAKKIIKQLKVTTSQRTVHLEWRAAAADVWRLIEQELQKR